jgi:hypothetical protein
LQRRHIIAAELKYCGKEVKRKLEQGPVDHETDFKVKVYASGRVSADPETLRALANLSERDIHKGSGLSRRIIRTIRHGGQVKPRTMQRIPDFLTRKPEENDQDNHMAYKNPQYKRQWERANRLPQRLATNSQLCRLTIHAPAGDLS